MNRYLTKFDEINKLSTRKFKSLDNLLDDAYDFFFDAYYFGLYYGMFGEFSDSYSFPIKSNDPSVESVIFHTYDGRDSFDLLEEAYAENDLSRIERILTTEFHRIFSESSLEGARNGGKTHKKWVTVGDDKVRDTHDYIEGITIPIADEFITFDGDYALYPGGFSNAENNVNCRCILEFS